MKVGKVVFAQEVFGRKRNEIADIIAEALDTESHYEGPPSFAYSAGGWVIEKSVIVRTPETTIEDFSSLRVVFDAMLAAGLDVCGDASVITSTTSHTGQSLANLFNLIKSKEKLIAHALNRETEAIFATLAKEPITTEFETVEDFSNAYNCNVETCIMKNQLELFIDNTRKEIGLKFISATLNYDEVFAYSVLVQKFNEVAIAQKHINPKQKPTDNEAYSFRCFLLKLGFIGPEYKTCRKILLSELEGNTAFKNGKQPKAAEGEAQTDNCTESEQEGEE